MDKISLDQVHITPITVDDNIRLAAIIRNTLEEFEANHPGTVYYDPTTDALFELFQTSGSAYFVARLGDIILGGAGIFPSSGLPEGTCELVKMYLVPEARGIGLGNKLIHLCLDKARESGYRQVYIETMPELSQAMKVYERFGFTYLKGPLGKTGHYGCEVWMLKQLG
jgi:putative acetyltransferase